MGVKRCWEVPNEELNWDLSGRDYVRTWRAETDDPHMQVLDVLAGCPQVPRQGDYYLERSGTADQWARATTLRSRQDPKNRYLWEFAVTFTTKNVTLPDVRAEMGKPGGGGVPRTGFGVDAIKSGGGTTGGYSAGNRPPDPVFHPAKIVVGTVKIQVPMETADRYEFTGGAWVRVEQDVRVAASTGEEFENKPTIDLPLLRIGIERNERNLARGVVQGCINTDMFLGFGPYFVKLNEWNAVEEFAGIYGYWRVAYELLVHPYTWLIPVLDQGYWYFSPGQNQLIQGTDRGYPWTRPRLLNGNRGLLQQGNPPVYRYYWPSNLRAPFSLLQLV